MCSEEGKNVYGGASRRLGHGDFLCFSLISWLLGASLQNLRVIQPGNECLGTTMGLFWFLKDLPESRQSPFLSLVATQSLVSAVSGNESALSSNTPASWFHG